MFKVADSSGSLLVKENSDGIEVIGSVVFAMRLEVVRGDFLELLELPGREIIFRKDFSHLPFSCFYLHKDNVLPFSGNDIYFSELLASRILVIHLENCEPLFLQILRSYLLALPSDWLILPEK